MLKDGFSSILQGNYSVGVLFVKVRTTGDFLATDIGPGIRVRIASKSDSSLARSSCAYVARESPCQHMVMFWPWTLDRTSSSLPDGDARRH